MCPEHRSVRIDDDDHAVAIAITLLTSLVTHKLLEGRAQVLFPFVSRISGMEPDIVGTHLIFMKQASVSSP